MRYYLYEERRWIGEVEGQRPTWTGLDFDGLDDPQDSLAMQPYAFAERTATEDCGRGETVTYGVALEEEGWAKDFAAVEWASSLTDPWEPLHQAEVQDAAEGGGSPDEIGNSIARLEPGAEVVPIWGQIRKVVANAADKVVLENH